MELCLIFAVSRQIFPLWRNGNGTRFLCRSFLGQFFFALSLTGRSTCNVGFIERPIVLGFAWWLLTGDPNPTLPLALFFELFWLDLFPIGSYSPPMAAFPYLIMLSLCEPLGWITPSSIAFPLAIVLPLAYAVPFVEYKLRQRHAQSSNLLVSRAEGTEPLEGLPGRLILRSCGEHLVVGLLSFCLIYLVMRAGCSLLLFSRNDAGLIPLDVNWPVLYAIAGIGGLLSLRIKRAYVVFAFSMLTLLVFKLT